MRLLLDTHCWLWLQAEPARFSPAVTEVLADTSHELLLSAASAWEIAIKYQLGKLPLPAPPSLYVPSRMRSSGTTPLAVLPIHALLVAELPALHRDPFDRLLVAQARHEKLTLVTADDAIGQYDVPTLRP